MKALFQVYDLAPAPLINGPKFDTLLRYSLVSVTNEGACKIPDINYNGYISPEVVSIATHMQTLPGATPNKADSFRETCPLDHFGASEYITLGKKVIGNLVAHECWENQFYSSINQSSIYTMVACMANMSFRGSTQCSNHFEQNQLQFNRAPPIQANKHRFNRQLLTKGQLDDLIVSFSKEEDDFNNNAHYNFTASHVKILDKLNDGEQPRLLKQKTVYYGQHFQDDSESLLLNLEQCKGSMCDDEGSKQRHTGTTLSAINETLGVVTGSDLLEKGFVCNSQLAQQLFWTKPKMLHLYNPVLLRLKSDIGLNFDTWHGVPLALNCEYDDKNPNLPVLTQLADSVEIRTLVAIDNTGDPKDYVSAMAAARIYKRTKLKAWQALSEMDVKSPKKSRTQYAHDWLKTSDVMQETWMATVQDPVNKKKTITYNIYAVHSVKVEKKSNYGNFTHNATLTLLDSSHDVKIV